MYDSSEIPTTNVAEITSDTQRQPSTYSVKLFKDIDIKSIRESTQLIGNETNDTGPLDRKDIFYSASLSLLPEYNEKRSKESTDALPINYHLSMIHEPKLTCINAKTGWYHVSHMIKGALRLLFDVSILKSPAFLTFAMSNFFYVFALYVPYMHIKSEWFCCVNFGTILQRDLNISERADLQSLPEKYSDLFIPTISIGNFIGRVSSGLIGSLLTIIHPCYLIGLPSIIAGTITITSAFVLEDDVGFQFVFCVLMGFFIGNKHHNRCAQRSRM